MKDPDIMLRVTGKNADLAQQRLESMKSSGYDIQAELVSTDEKLARRNLEAQAGLIVLVIFAAIFAALVIWPWLLGTLLIVLLFFGFISLFIRFPLLSLIAIIFGISGF